MASNSAVRITFVGKDAVTPVVSGINNSLDNFKKQAMTGFGMAAGFGFQQLAAQAAGVLLQFGKDAIDAASNYQQAFGKMEAVVGDAKDEIVDFAKSSAISMGISQRAVYENVAGLANLMQATGMAKDASAEMSLNLVKLASDMAAFNNRDVEEVLTAMRAGLVGEAEPARRLGVFISQAAVENRIFAAGLVRTKSQITDQMRVWARYALILEQTTNQQGQFNREINAYANQQQILDASLEDLKKSFGDFLIGYLTPIISAFNDLIARTSWMVESLKKLGGGVSGFIDILVGGLRSIIPFHNALFDLLGVVTVLTDWMGYTKKTTEELTVSSDAATVGMDGLRESVGQTTETMRQFEAVKFPEDFTKYEPKTIFTSMLDQIKTFREQVNWLASHPNFMDKLVRRYASVFARAMKVLGPIAGDPKDPRNQIANALLTNIGSFGVQNLGTAFGLDAPHWTNIGRKLGEKLGLPAGEKFVLAITTNMENADWPLVIAEGRIKFPATTLPVLVPTNPPSQATTTTSSGPAGDNAGAGGGGALGGAMAPHRRYLVGERGPEWLVMGSQGGYLQSNGGGGSIIVNVDGQKLFEIMNRRLGRALAMGA